MMNKNIFAYSLLSSALLLSPTLLFSQTAMAQDDSAWDFYGDFRARYESDTDSRKSDGSERDDRDRLRIRLRGGLNYKFNPNWSAGLRIRTGSNDSQQSPHITIDDYDHNDTGDSHVNMDKAFIKGKFDNTWLWIGKNGNPLWKNNEMVWDDDVTVLGGALGVKTKAGSTNLEFKGGYFALPVGMRDYAGKLTLLQAIMSTKVDDVSFKGALAYLNIDADKNDTSITSLLDNNGARDYQNWIVSLQAKTKVSDKPLTLGLDYIVNSKNYSATDSDPFTAFHHDEDDAWVVSLRWGDLKKAGHWQIRYDYAHVEALAVNNSYAQDDWVRWGNATQTRASNFKGSEFRLAYAFTPKLNLVARYYVVDAIEPRSAGAVSKEDGNRFRLDLNWKF